MLGLLLPPFQGQFESLPRDPSLSVELLVLERASGGMAGPWAVSGALIRSEGGPAAWVAGFSDDPSYGGGGSEPEAVWEYLTDKGGGNGYTFEVAFLWIEKPEDAVAVIVHVNDSLLREGHPLGFGSSIVANLQDEPASLPDSPDPCVEHLHFDHLPFHVADVVSWRLVAELVRRQPHELWVLRTYPFDMYDCLTVCRRSSPLELPMIRFNRNGSHADYSWFGPEPAPPGAGDDLISWADYLFADDPRTWIVDLEARLGLARVAGHARTPSTPASLALRWIAQFLSAQIGSRPRWTAWTVNDPDASPLVGSFQEFEPAARWAIQRDQGHLGVWFVGTHDGSPRFALSWSGDLWSIEDKHWHLAAERRRGESITSLVARTAGSAMP